MLCDLCHGFLKDISEGRVDQRLPAGWNADDPDTNDDDDVLSKMRFASVPCRFQHCKTLADLQASGKSCDLCMFLGSFSRRQFARDRVGTQKDDIVTLGLATPASIYTRPSYDEIGAILFLVGEDYKPRPLKLQVYVPAPATCAILEYEEDSNGVARARGSVGSLSLGRPVLKLESESQLDQLTVLCRAWMDDCDVNHPKCQVTTGFIPRRVIDVGSSDGSCEPKLHATTEDDKNTPYVTLSYCWGAQTWCNKNLKTTPKTLGARLRRIRFKSLPKCCRDAVTITRKLGFRFLWIDALCIIQEEESKADWMAESLMMESIYANSSFTISAATSHKCSSRIIQPREPPVVGIQVDISRDIQAETIGIREMPSDLAEASNISEITKRGWTMQERILSRRILHFTSAQLYWQCTTDEHSEDGRNKFEMPVGLRDHRVYMRQNLDPLEARDKWFEIVEEHNRLEFSVESDRLPALAGIAKVFGRHFRSMYFFGLWTIHLPQNLLWVASEVPNEPDGKQRFTARGYIPSWSWASVPGRLYCTLYADFAPETKVLVEVRYASKATDSEGSDFICHARERKMVLRGKLQRLHYYCPPYKVSGHLRRRGDESEDQDFGPQRHFSMDRERKISRDCWGILISHGYPGTEYSRFAVLVLEAVNAELFVFKRCGVAGLDNELCNELFSDAAEQEITLI